MAVNAQADALTEMNVIGSDRVELSRVDAQRVLNRNDGDAFSGMRTKPEISAGHRHPTTTREPARNPAEIDMSNEIATRGNALVPASMTEAIRLAEFMAKSTMLPNHLCDKPSDCLMVVMQSQRWGMDPFAVAQCTSSVHGKLCYEGKLVAAAMYATGIIEGRLQYEFSGTGQNRTVTVTGRPRGAKIDQVVTGTIGAWRTSNDNWTKIPDDMLVYRGTRQWARRYAPEAMLGVYTPDEIEDAPTQAPVTVTVTSAESTELFPYPTDQFDENLPKWLGVIESGRRTADDIIAMVETKGALSDDQKAKIRGDVTDAEFTETKKEQAA